MVGRAAERALFADAVAAAELPFCFLYLHGPGGIGKTTLLESFRDVCQERNIPTALLDGRYVDPTPSGFQSAMQAVIPSADRFPDRFVLFVDTYERLEGLDGWLRDIYLPSLPDGTLVVMAGRNPVQEGWRTDSGWQTLLRTIALGNLPPEDCSSLLAARHIPAEQHSAVLDLTHGYPLALSLVTELLAQQGDLPAPNQPTPDMVRTLMQRLLEDVPSAAHREALEASALLRVTTESTLAALLEEPVDIHRLFVWLSHLSFMDTGPIGLFPHDLARDAILADLRWRNPERYLELHRRARQHFTSRLKEAPAVEQQRILWDYIFLHRDNPVVRGALTWQDAVNAYADAARESDFPALRAMVERHEGAESADILARWWLHPAHRAHVFRDNVTGEPLGFLSFITLEKTDAADKAADPAIAAATALLARRAPLRPGETANHFRFWMARDTYHGVSTVQSLIIIYLVRYYLSTPHLAFTFFPVTSPEFWMAAFTYAEMERLPEADFTVGGRTYGVFGHDWRLMPPLAWLAALAEKETDPRAANATAPPKESPTNVLDEAAFLAAVRDALKRYAETDGLLENPLLDTRCVSERSGNSTSRTARAMVLKALIREAIEALQSSPRQARAYRVLYNTYLQPAPSQEKAAERLDLPFSTYRRHLMEGIVHVSDALWLLETGRKSK